MVERVCNFIFLKKDWGECVFLERKDLGGSKIRKDWRWDKVVCFSLRSGRLWKGFCCFLFCSGDVGKQGNDKERRQNWLYIRSLELGKRLQKICTHTIAHCIQNSRLQGPLT